MKEENVLQDNSGNLNQGTTSPAQLTPSELIFLSSLFWTNTELNGVIRQEVHNPSKPQDVVRRMLASALLANEEAGAIRLEVVQEDTFFGLVSRTILRAVRVENIPQWPTGSLEFRIIRTVQLIHTGRVADIVYNWLAEDSTDPWNSAVERMKEMMVYRGVLGLVMTQKKELRFFTRTFEHYFATDRTSALVNQQSTESALGLLEGCKHTRPVIYNQLIKEVNDGITRRHESE